jgi:hypothetical protein
MVSETLATRGDYQSDAEAVALPNVNPA